MPRFAAFFVLFSLLPSMAYAGGQEDANKAQARELAQQAADLLDEKKYEEAIERANRAEALYHAPFHIFVIASALEGLSRLTEAATMYERLVAEPLPSSAPSVFKEAQTTGNTRLRELLARIPTVLVRVRGVPSGRAQATLDGEALDLVSGTATRANPGDHVVRVSAEGYRPFEQKLTLPARGGVVVVDATLVPLGANNASDPGTSPSESPKPEGPTKLVEPDPKGEELSGEEKHQGSSGPSGSVSKTPAWVALGIGGAGLVVGGVTGVLELGKVSTLKEKCPNGACGPEQQGELDSARTLATVSTIGFAVGGAAVVTGAVLLFVGKKPEAKKSGVWMTPFLSTEMVGVSGVF